MAHNEHSPTPPAVPADMLASHKQVWHAFTRGMLWNSIATAVVLIFLLLVFKVF